MPELHALQLVALEEREPAHELEELPRRLERACGAHGERRAHFPCIRQDGRPPPQQVSSRALSAFKRRGEPAYAGLDQGSRRSRRLERHALDSRYVTGP